MQLPHPVMETKHADGHEKERRPPDLGARHRIGQQAFQHGKRYQRQSCDPFGLTRSPRGNSGKKQEW